MPIFFRTLIREPSLHFIAAASLIFAVNEYAVDRRADSSTIRVTGADVELAVYRYLRQFGEIPDTDEISSLVEAQVEDEILYREALQTGLADDEIVRRRLVQKMEFLLEEFGGQLIPTEDELRTYFADHRDKYTFPATVSFQQRPLDSQTNPIPASLPASFERAELSDVVRYFGDKFGSDLFSRAIKPDSWQGPVDSGVGAHLVLLTDRTSARYMTFSEARSRIERDWLRQARMGRYNSSLAAIRSKYKIIDDTGYSPW